MASTTLAVGHKITIGSAVYSSSDHSRLTSLAVQSALDVPVNSASISLAPPDGISAAPDEKLAIELGYDGETALVYTGLVDSVEYTIDSLVLRARGSFRKLLAARFNLLYQKSAAGNIAAALGGKLGLKSGNIEDGPEYPSLALSDSEDAYQGLRRLADQCGFDLYADTSDNLVFARYTADQTHEFQYGVNVLSLSVEIRNPLTTGAVVYGESPASFGQGSDGASWLAKKTVDGNAGDSGGLLLSRFVGAARTQDAASNMAAAMLAKSSPKRACAVTTLGAPEVQLGHAIRISKMPAGGQNGTFKVMGVEHRLDRRKGFITAIRGLEV